MKKRKPRKARTSEKSKDGWILYLMVHFPAVIFWKIGITGRSATARAADIDEAVWGCPIPVCIVVIPGAYGVEQWLHKVCGFMSVDFYKGDGHTEWFWFPAVLIALPVMLAIWGVYFFLIGCAMKWDAFGWYVDFLKVLAVWIVDFFR